VVAGAVVVSTLRLQGGGLHSRERFARIRVVVSDFRVAHVVAVDKLESRDAQVIQVGGAFACRMYESPKPMSVF
jgi:hypothetical protein